MKNEIFINKAILKHGNIYDYSKVIYINSLTKVELICKEHNSFFIRPNLHIKGQGCPTCGLYKNSMNRINRNKSIILEKFEKVHGSLYNYKKVKYIKNNIKVEIICNKHMSFFMTPNSHISGQGCPKCGKEKMSVLNTKSLEFILSSFKDTHGHLYDYSNIKYSGTKNKVDIICKIHGTFSQTPEKHIGGNGCPKCNLSKGELKVSKYLEKNLIKYEIQKKFNNCISSKGQKLKFDFYLPKLNICIEYDGEQHFTINKFFGGEVGFISIVDRDNIKNRYCKNNNIKLIRIPFYKYNDIENILDLEINI